MVTEVTTPVGFWWLVFVHIWLRFCAELSPGVPGEGEEDLLREHLY
jgi:hypothetical protein